jgi:hypothetical protein
MRKGLQTALVAGLLVLALTSCATMRPEVIQSSKSALQLRSMQSRVFETGDRVRVYRAVLATLQDLGYTITKLEPDAGTVTGDKLAQLRLTVMVYPRGTNRTIVRANAIVKLSPQVEQGYQVDSLEFYQQRFFEPLSKALFLTAMNIEDGEGGTDPLEIDPPEVENSQSSG